MQLALSKIKNTQQNLQEYTIFEYPKNVFHNFQNIHHYIVNL